ncbi:HAMP domain-containing sensor histidine kinase [Altererythrobacter aquiaggeris]|uniref:sensor histidine kinase n=1 Tax=Aestuarierythrobacter aquiaggeris TaxID=1898396 RepID=UPI0030177426
MSERADILAYGATDAENLLISADEPLASLQRRCGGDIPGRIAIPQLREMVEKATANGRKIARTMVANDGSEQISAWIEITPTNADGAGCSVAVASWQTASVNQLDPVAEHDRDFAIIRHAAEIELRTDIEHRLVSVISRAPDVVAATNIMRANLGKRWTDFVEFEGNTHRQPMHWRLLDGAELRLEASGRVWRAAIAPLKAPGATADAGFEIYLHSHDVPPEGSQFKADTKSAPSHQIGREIAPVLRQPIARIIANAETIRSRLAGPISDEYSGYAADISAAGEHLLALIDDLADLEIVEGDSFSVAPDIIDLGDVARRAAGILAVRAQGRKITIAAPQESEKLPAVGEFRRVLQVLLNLVGNAINYSPEGSQIWLRLEDTGTMATLTVADQGQGLSPDQQQRVFGKFERLGRSGDGGSGLGLFISKTLAKAMRGDLTVNSAQGQGARFTLALPKPD